MALNGVLFSSACRAMPSSRSPRDMSRYSARPLSTLSRRFSSRTPVWMRSTSRGGDCLGDLTEGMADSAAEDGLKDGMICRLFYCLVHWYIYTIEDKPCPRRRLPQNGKSWSPF